ncbi:MAG: MaoC/PaaZ C-terminal domain-containing protein [Alphaproteobacteria bacterium]
MQLDLNFTYNDVEVGYKTGRSRGRTATETDVVNFMMLTGNWIEIHSNVEFCKTTPFGQRLVQGSLVLAMSQGLFSAGRAVAAFYGLDGVRFIKPVFIGDTIYLQCEVIKKRDKDDRFGLLTWRMNVTNQRGELVQKAEYTQLTYKVMPQH